MPRYAPLRHFLGFEPRADRLADTFSELKPWPAPADQGLRAERVGFEPTVP